MGAIPSTLHMKVKFPAKHGVAIMRGSQQMARQCLIAIVNRKNEQAKENKIAEEVPL